MCGLGPGYMDEEIQAVGGPVPSAGAKIDGLADALQIIRGAWSHSGYNYHGKQHSVHELVMEPKPAHDIPVWLGAFKPRSLAVTGRFADGWIPSLGFAPADQIPAMRKQIGAAAEAAGRDPAAVRGIYNVGIHIDDDAAPRTDCLTGSPARIIAELHRFMELGFTGFNLAPTGPDSSDQVRRIAEEILPAMRGSV